MKRIKITIPIQETNEIMEKFIEFSDPDANKYLSRKIEMSVV